MANSTQVGRIVERALLEHGYEKGTKEYKRNYSRLKEAIKNVHYVGNRTYCITTVHCTIEKYFNFKEKKKNV